MDLVCKIDQAVAAEFESFISSEGTWKIETINNFLIHGGVTMKKLITLLVDTPFFEEATYSSSLSQWIDLYFL